MLTDAHNNQRKKNVGKKSPKNYKNKVPKDIDKWARIACNIAKHYEGKVSYFEIWNEPDLYKFFEGTKEEICSIYEKTSLLIKKEVKGAKVGGMAFAIATGELSHYFLKYVKEKNLPLDFYSFHRYHFDPDEFYNVCVNVKKMLDDYGFNDVITILDEWNFNINFQDQLNASYKAIKMTALFVKVLWVYFGLNIDDFRTIKGQMLILEHIPQLIRKAECIPDSSITIIVGMTINPIFNVGLLNIILQLNDKCSIDDAVLVLRVLQYKRRDMVCYYNLMAGST